MEYDLQLVDIHGDLHPVTAVGLDRLTRESPGGPLHLAMDQFPHIPPAELEQPEGKVEVLLGQDYAGYLPEVEERKGHLLLLKSFFGSGRLLSGRTGDGT